MLMLCCCRGTADAIALYKEEGGGIDIEGGGLWVGRCIMGIKKKRFYQVFHHTLSQWFF
jgi:hypothetical protein